MSSEQAQADEPFGGENLEVMADAVNYNNYLRDLVRQHSGNANSALDFGAGIGTFSDSLDIPAQRMHCVEPDERAQRILRENGFNAHADLSGVPDASLPYAYSLNVLEHIDDDEAALRELFRVLQPGGRLFIYVPAFKVLFTSMDRHVGHVRRYRRPQLVERIRNAGFDVHSSAYADALGFFATLVFRLFDKPEPSPLNPRLIRIYDRICFPLSRLLSIPLAKILGKNVWVSARKPE